jgi:hypothetical protein
MGGHVSGRTSDRSLEPERMRHASAAMDPLSANRLAAHFTGSRAPSDKRSSSPGSWRPEVTTSSVHSFDKPCSAAQRLISRAPVPTVGPLPLVAAVSPSPSLPL